MAQINNNPWDMTGKVCIVTGASSGIGEATALIMARRGASVTLCGRDKTRLSDVYDKCVEASGGHKDKFITVTGDLNSHETRERTISKTIDKFGHFNILVASAGVTLKFTSLLDTTEEAYDKLMDTNVKAVFFLLQEAVPHLEKTNGCIVTLSSMTSSLVSAPGLTYPMSKAAIDHMTRCLALDLAPKGIRINSVNPSFTPTLILRDKGVVSEISPKVRASEEVKHPLQNRCVTVEEIAEAIVFLTSDASSFITGENLKVDGGRSLAGPWQRIEYDHLKFHRINTCPQLHQNGHINGSL